MKLKSIDKSEFLLFSFLEFCFFWNSPNGKAVAMLFGIGNPAWLSPLIAVPYILAALIYNFGGTKYFISEENKVVGILILKVRQDALILHSLAISPTKRKRGVGSLVLAQVEELAKQMKLPWLELEVLKRNLPAQKLYWKFGFKIHAKRRLTFVMRKRV